MLVNLGTWEAEIRRIFFPGHPEETFHETPSQWEKAGLGGSAFIPVLAGRVK
jgi:hypothetical protein